MTHIGEELTLELVEFLQFFDQFLGAFVGGCVVERDGDLIRHGLQYRDVVLRKGVKFFGLNINDADFALAHTQRNDRLGLCVEQKRVGVIAVCFLAAAIFWSGFEQAGSSMNLFADRLTDRTVFGWEMPASWLQSVNSTFIILLAPVFSALWLRLGSRSPSIPAKFAYGLIQLGLGFLVLAWASLYTANGNLVSPSWLVVTYFLHTTGELCLSPVGLSSITKLSPPRFVGQMMGIWFMGAALGNLIAGLVAGLIEKLPLPQLFGSVCLFTAGAGVVLLLFAGPIRKMAGGVR